MRIFSKHNFEFPFKWYLTLCTLGAPYNIHESKPSNFIRWTKWSSFDMVQWQKQVLWWSCKIVKFYIMAVPPTQFGKFGIWLSRDGVAVDGVMDDIDTTFSPWQLVLLVLLILSSPNLSSKISPSLSIPCPLALPHRWPRLEPSDGLIVYPRRWRRAMTLSLAQLSTPIPPGSSW